MIKPEGKFVTISTGPPTLTSATIAQATDITATTKVCIKSDATTPHAPDSTETNNTVRPVMIIVILISEAKTALANTPRALSHIPALSNVKMINAQEKNNSFWGPKRPLIASVGVSTLVCLKRCAK